MHAYCSSTVRTVGPINVKTTTTDKLQVATVRTLSVVAHDNDGPNDTNESTVVLCCCCSDDDDDDDDDDNDDDNDNEDLERVRERERFSNIWW